MARVHGAAPRIVGARKNGSRKTQSVPPASDDVRSSVLAAAVRLIDEGGLARLSMREVARAAGVSHQAPYHYFEDRESILAALAEGGFNILADRLEKARDPGEPPVARFAAMARVYVEFAIDHPSLFRVMFRPDFVDMGRFPHAKACGDRAFAPLPAAVADCIQAGLPAEPSPQALLIMGWSLAHGLACLLLDGPLAKVLPEAAQARDALVSETIAAMQRLLEASMPSDANSRGAVPGGSAVSRGTARARRRPRRGG
jgi:AcrR family transcriptional regulator